MKIKKKIKGKVAKFDNGGKKPQEESWTMSTPTTNQITTNDTYSSNFGSDINQNAWTNQNTDKTGFGTDYKKNALAGIPALASTINGISGSDQPTPAKVQQGTEAIGDAAISYVPGYGQFYGATRDITKSIQGALPGNTLTDPKTGLSYTKKDTSGARGFDHLLTPSHTQASKTWGKAAAANSTGDKVKYAFEGIGDMFGLTQIAKTLQAAAGKDDNSKQYDRLKALTPRFSQDTSTFAYGGGINKYGGGGSSDIELERYSLPSHAQQNSEVPNTHLDGKPIQIDKHETILREKGNNYVYSDTIKNNTGNTFAKDSILTKDRYKKPHYDAIAESTSADELKSLTVKNDLAKQMQEMKSFGGMFKFGGSISKEQYKNGGNGAGGNVYDTVRGAKAYNNYLSKFNTDDSEPIVTDGSNTQPLVDFGNGSLAEEGPNTDAYYRLHNQILAQKENKPKLTLKSPSNPTTPVVGITPQNEQKNPNKWGLDGDQLQLAGTLPAIAYNTAMSMQPADKEPTYYNPYQDKIKDIYSNRRFNEQPIINENQLDFNKGRADIDNSSTSDSVRRANMVALNSNLVDANSKTRLEGQKMNNELQGQLGEVYNNLGQQRVAEDRRVSEINAQNKGRKQLFAAEAATQTGQALTETGKAKNQNLTNQVELAALNNIYADFGTKYKNIDDFKKNASYDEIIAFNKYQEQKAVPRMTIKKAKK